jgi:hypothetical protein
VVCSNVVNLLDKNLHTIKKNTEALSLDVSLVANVERTKYIFTSREYNTGQNDKIMIDNNYLENVANFEYLGKTPLN